MAAKAKQTRTPKSLEAAPIIDTQLTTIPIAAMPVLGGVEIEAKITTSDIADVFVSDHEDKLMGLKQHIAAVLRSLRADVSKLEAEMKLEAEAQAKAHTFKPAAALCKAMQDFLGVKYVSVVNAKGLDVANQEVTAEVVVLSEEDSLGNKTSYKRHDVIDRDFKLPASASIKAKIGKLEELATSIREQERKNEDVNKQLADLPRVARRAKAAMTRIAMSGQAVTGPQLLQAMGDVSTPRMLPSR